MSIHIDELEAGYREVARDEAREVEASEWAEALVGDVSDPPTRGETSG